jgi:hypothetical protein
LNQVLGVVVQAMIWNSPTASPDVLLSQNIKALRSVLHLSEHVKRIHRTTCGGVSSNDIGDDSKVQAPDFVSIPKLFRLQENLRIFRNNHFRAANLIIRSLIAGARFLDNLAIEICQNSKHFFECNSEYKIFSKTKKIIRLKYSLSQLLTN